MSNENIRKEWEEFKEEYKEYLLDGEKLWRFTLEKVKKFIVFWSSKQMGGSLISASL